MSRSAFYASCLYLLRCTFLLAFTNALLILMYELAIYVVEFSVLDTVYLHIFFLCLGFVF